MRFPSLFLFAYLASCTPQEADKGGDGDTNDRTISVPPTVPSTPTDTGETTPPYEFDCSSIPNSPTVLREVPAARGSYDLTFDDDGNIMGWDNGLRKADYYGDSSSFSPALQNLQGMAWLPDGDLAVSEINTAAIIRVDATTGGTSLITADTPAYGLKLGPDQMLWAGTDNDLVRIDPNTGDREMLINDPRFNVRSIDFNLDFTKLYMGTFMGDGRLWVVDLDANYDPVGDAYVFHPNVGNGLEHDALGVDICGNLWVGDYGTATVYRLTPDGQKSVYLEWGNSGHYGHGIAWGSGIGGWSHLSIFMPEPWYGNTVVELGIGVPSRSYVP